MKTFDLKIGFKIDSIAEYLQQCKNSPAVCPPGLSAIYSIKDQSGLVVYIGKSDSPLGAFSKIADRIVSKKRVFYFAIALVPSKIADAVTKSLVDRFNPQYNRRATLRSPNVIELVERAIVKISGQFTLSDVVEKVSEIEPHRSFKRESIYAAMARVRNKGIFYTKRKLSGPNQCSVYEKTK